MRETIDQNPSRVERFKEGVLEDKGFKMPSRKRPMNTNECKSISDIERWRHELTKDISRKIEKSHEPGLTDAQMRDLNDLINKLLAEKAKWEYRVIELGGPDYIRRGNGVALGDEGVLVPGTRGYKYFGRSKNLPGVRELFEQAAQMQKKIAPEELAERVDADYFGFRDEDDGSLLAYENVLETREISKYVANASEGVMQELRREFVPEPASVSKPQLEAWLVKRRQQELANRFSEGLNPAFQSTLHFEAFNFGHVNRALRKANSIGGKGQNVAIACANYGEADKISVLQVAGGVTGDYITHYLDELSVEHFTIAISKTTRTCTTVLDMKTGEMTELIEPAGRLSAAETRIVEDLAVKLLTRSPKLEGIALCGTLPPGLSGIYSVVTKLKPPGTLVLLDAFQNTDCLHSGKVDILKINAEEARILAECSDETSLLDVGLLIHNLYKLKILAITNGPAEALLIESCTDTRSFSVSRFTLPDLHGIIKDITGNSESPVSSSVSLPEVTGTLPNFDANQKPLLNPLGAGDACSAVFLLEYLDTHNAPTSYLQGLAAASASCLVIDYTSHFDLSIQKAIAAEIQVDTVILTKEVEFSRLAITDEL